MKLTIEYDPMAGHVYKDGESQGWVDDIIHSTFFAATKIEDRDDYVVTVASALLIDYFRLRVAQGIINPDQIQFKFNDEILKTNKYGRIEHWPKGFCDHTMYICGELLTIGADAAKAKGKKRLSEMSVDNELTGEQDISWKNN